MNEKKISASTLCALENLEQFLSDLMGDFLDDDATKLEFSLGGFKEKKEPEKSDLHEKMAKAAIKALKKGVIRT